MNINKVPKKQWERWSLAARESFNRTYDFLYCNQKLVTHPKMTEIKPEHWKTIAWNAAWIAADSVDDTIPTEVVNV